MADKQAVVLEIGGDSSKLSKAFDEVGESSERMASDVESSSRKMDDAGNSLDGLGESTDAAEGKFQGFADTLTGTSDIMTGFREGDIVGMATGFADLAGGLTEFLIPALSSMAGFLAGPLRAAMSFIAAHPLLITLGILIALFVTLWTTSETFRNIVIGVFNAVGGAIKTAFGAAVDWLIGAWNAVTGFFERFGGAIGRIFSGIGSAISGAFKGAINGIIGFLNGGIGAINGIIRGINNVSGIVGIPAIPQIPKIPKLHTGGPVTGGMPGEEVLRVLQVGETVAPSGQGAGSTLTVTGNGGLYEVIQHGLRTGEIQLRDSAGQRVRVA